MTRQRGRFEHIDFYTYATVPSQRGSPEQRKSAAVECCCRDHWQRRTRSVRLFSTATHSRKAHPLPSKIMHASLKIAFMLAARLRQHRQTQDVQQCSRDGFLPLWETMLCMALWGEILEGAESLQQQGLPLTDRHIQVSSVKITQTNGSFYIFLLLSETHSHTEKLSYFSQ